jgi:outer membrane protein assembly factor BamA
LIPPVKKYYLLLLISLSNSFSGWSQPGTGKLVADTGVNIMQVSISDTAPQKRALFIIADIVISGNKKTKPYIVERELPFKKGDSVYLPDLVEKFRRAKELLINTKLFNDAIVSLKSFRGYLVDIQIDVKERWYIFPVPYFKPVDRNISAWADKNYSLARVNYGLKFAHNNFTGRNDKLKLWLITGYTRQIQLNYDQPYADKLLKHGFGSSFLYAALKEINVSTDFNKQTFLNADTLRLSHKYLVEQWAGSLSYFYRPAIKTRHLFRLGFIGIKLDSAVVLANPKYFSNSSQHIFYPEFSYSLEYQNVDYVPYVLRGFMGDVNFLKRGTSRDMNLWQLTGRFTRGWSLGWKTYFGLQGYGVIKLPFDQPYFNQRAFGYGDIYLRGLEKYVVDGVAAAMLRNTLRKQLIKFNFNFFNIPTLERMPFRIYAKVYGDIGYAYNKNFKQNSLVNQMLYTAGTGVDVVTIYDLIFRFEYSFNQLGQPGFFFHIRNDF